MKVEFKGKIIGFEVFTPDAKTPSREAVRVKLQIAPTNSFLGKPSKGVLTIDEKELPKFPLKGYLTITVQDSQQVLDFSRPGRGGSDDAQLSIEGAGAKASRGGRKATDKVH